jgi:hypothetical protein
VGEQRPPAAAGDLPAAAGDLPAAAGDLPALIEQRASATNHRACWWGERWLQEQALCGPGAGRTIESHET